jgi:hypothetical protein
MNQHQKTEIGYFENTLSYRFKKKYNDFVRWVFKFLYNRFNPYKPYGNTMFFVSIENRKEIEKKFSYKVRQWLVKLQDIFQFSLLKHWKIKFPPHLTIHQVKEKFGGLRIYMSGADDHISGMLFMAERMASKTCQDTGSVGSLCVKDGWYRVLSPTAAKKQGFTKVEEQNDKS